MKFLRYENSYKHGRMNTKKHTLLHLDNVDSQHISGVLIKLLFTFDASVKEKMKFLQLASVINGWA